MLGAFPTITVTYLLKMQRIVHFVLTEFFAMFIGLVVFVIISLDQPLSGPLAIDSGPYQLVLDRLIETRGDLEMKYGDYSGLELLFDW